jgi:glycogen debranching enzyme
MDARPVNEIDPVELLGYADPSAQAEATGVDKLVLKRGNLFLVANRLGDLWPPGARDLGLYLADTRHLSAWRLQLGEGKPLCLSSQVSPDYRSQIDFTVTGLQHGELLGREPLSYLHLRREQLIDDALVERLTLTNFLPKPVQYAIDLEWAADFADVFEARGAQRPRRGRYEAPEVHDDFVRLRYHGLDGRTYVTEIHLERYVGSIGARGIFTVGARGARLIFHLESDETGGVTLSAAAGLGGAPQVRQRPYDERVRARQTAYDNWAASCTRFSTSHDLFDRALEQAVADMKALTVEHFGMPVISAGIPWYTCPFGRDALITGFEALLCSPNLARDALLFLARRQGEKDDPGRDEEPGKILHEIRLGEMATAGEIPHTPYYGSVDATPLFLILLSEYFLWTDDRPTVEGLLPAAERALTWLERHGDIDGDGFIEYQRRAPRGLRNQGWKDSLDGVPFANGIPAEPPIALIEVQGYACDAWRRMAQLYRRLGRHGEAALLAERSRKMRRLIEERFWMDGPGTYALALDREKKRVDAVTSNPGHLLFCRAASEAHAHRVIKSLLSPAMWSGWGIRTLAKGQGAYNPLSYHNGTVWPHDNAMAAMGMCHYGMTHAAGQVLDGLWQASHHFRLWRLPELFCGLDRVDGAFPVHYPVACSPQAWASASFFLLLRACLGLYPDAPRRTLHIVSPSLPPALTEVALFGVRIGAATANIRFTRTNQGTFAAVTDVDGGPLHVRIDVRR